ncbi:hypothetical protein Q3G72_026496 [Acer saccharum]|nr:hypothetical protein Q3G72_026496 [Acer saccharum]
MGSVTLSVKFLETQIEFGIDSPKKYTLDTLWANVYMYICSTIPEPSEAFKADVRLPWTRKYVHMKDDDQFDDEDINGVTLKDSGVKLSRDDEGEV